MTPYIVPVKGDFSAIEDKVKKVQGQIKRIGDNEILIKLDLDTDPKKFKSLIKELEKTAPELVLQIQYDINTRALQKKLQELKTLKGLKLDLDLDEGKIDEVITEMVSNIKEGFKSAELSGDELRDKLRGLFQYIKSAGSEGASVSFDISSLKEIDDATDGMVSSLYKSTKTLTGAYDSIDDAIEATQKDVDYLNSSLEYLNSKGSFSSIADSAKAAEDAMDDAAESADEVGDAYDRAKKKAKDLADLQQTLVTPSQTFDNTVQKDLVYLENFKNTIKEIDRLKLEPETEETKKKIEELNDLAEYFVSNISAIRSENGHTISQSMMMMGGTWSPALNERYPNDALKEMYKIAHAYGGAATNQPAREYSSISDELSRIEEASEKTRKSLAADVAASKKYVENLKADFEELIGAREELARKSLNKRDREIFSKEVEEIPQKHPEIAELSEKFKTWDDAMKFTASDEWLNFLATLPQARKYLEDIGYDFEKASRASEGFADASGETAERSEEAAAAVGEAADKVEEEGEAAEESAKQKEKFAEANEHVSEIKPPVLFEDASGQLSFIEKLTDSEKELADAMEEVSAEAKKAEEQIEGQLSLDFNKAADGQEKYEHAIVNTNKELERMHQLAKAAFEEEKERAKLERASVLTEESTIRKELVDLTKRQAAEEKERARQERSDVLTEESTIRKELLELTKKQAAAEKERADLERASVLTEESTIRKELENLRHQEDERTKSDALTLDKITASQKLDKYYNELEQLGLITKEVEDRFDSLYKKLDTAKSSAGLKTLTKEATIFKNEMEQSVAYAKNVMKRASTSDADTEKQINALYDERERIIKQIGALQLDNVRRNKDTLDDDEKRRQNNEIIVRLSKEALDYQRQIYLNEQVLADREQEVLELQKAQVVALKNAEAISEARSRQDMTNQVSKWKELVVTLQNSGKYTEEFSLALQEAYVKLSQFDAASGSIDEINLAFEKLDDTMKSINSGKGLSDFKKANEASIAKLNLQIEEFIQKNTRMGLAFKQRFDALKIEWDSEQSISEVAQLAAQFAKLKSEVAASEKLGKSFFDTLRQRAMGVNAQLIAQYLSWQDLLRYIRQAVEVVRDLDYALVDLKKTTTMTTSDLKEFYFSANDTAKEMGVTTEEIINQAAAWSRLGYSSKEAATEMAALSSQFAQISPGMDVETATDGLVSAMKAFHIDVTDVEREVMDVINRTGNTMATTNEEIVEMLKRSSAAMAAANNSLKETIALESAAVQITRNAETTGTALRTISMRIRGYDEETEEYIGGIEELSGKIADFTKTTQNPMGISLFTDETKTTYKSTYQILKDISEVYNDLSDADQANLLENLAGKRGGQVLAGILSDFSEVERAMGEIEKSAGSADAEMSIVEESIDYKLNRLQQTWVGIIQQLIDNGDLGKLIDALTSLSEILGEIITTIGPLPTLISGLGLRELILHADKLPDIMRTILDMLPSGSVMSDATADTLRNLEKLEGVFVNTKKEAKDSTESTLEAIGKLGNVFGPIATEVVEPMSETTVETLSNVEKLSGAFGQVGETVESAGEAIETMETAQNVVTQGASKLVGAFKGLIPVLTNPVTIMVGLGAATIALYNYIDKANERQRKKISEISKEYNELSSTLDGMNSELANIDKQIKTIQDKGKISLVEQQQLNNLRTQNELLKIAIEEQERLLELKAKDLNDENKKLFNNSYGRIDEAEITSPSDERLTGYKDESNPLVTYSYGENLSSALEKAANGEYNDNLNELLTIYQSVQKAREEALKTIQKYGNVERELTDQEKEALEGARAILDDSDANFSKLAIQIGNVKSELLNMRDVAQRSGDDTFVSDIENALKLVYKYSGSENEWNAMQIDSIFDTSELGTTREELEALASAGELDDSVLEKYPKLKEAIEALNLILPKGKNAFDIFKDELAATAEAAEDADNALSDALDSAKSWEAERNNTLIKLGLAKETTKGIQYDDEWTNYLNTIRELNPELAENEKELEKCALANLQFSKGVEDLSKNFKTYKEALKDADKITPEYSEAINALANDLTYLTGIKFSIDDASDFLSVAKNVELLEEAINGSDEALRQLQQRAKEGVEISAEIDPALKEELKVALGLDTEEFDKQLTALQVWLETADLGTIEAQAYLDDSPFIKALVNLAKESSEMADKIKKIFEGLGWDVTWETTKMKIPTTESWDGSKNSDVHISSTYGPGGAKQVNWKYQEVEVPTNIRFERSTDASSRKTSTSSYTPTSLSPSQKSGAATNINKANKKDTDSYDKFYDYFERLIEKLDNQIDRLDAHLQDVVGSFAKNSLIDAQEDLVRQKMEGYSSAIEMYSKQASEALSKIPSDIAEKLINGAVDIDEFVGSGNEEVYKAIENYTKWAEKIEDCEKQLIELKEVIRQMELQKFNNILQDFTDQTDLRSSSGIDLISKQIALMKEAGQLIGEGFYKRQKELTERNLQTLEQAKNELAQQMRQALDKGIDVGSDEWLEMVNALTQLEGKILDAKKAIEEFDNALLELHTEVFNRIQDQFDSYDNELSNLIGLFSEDKIADESGNWTDEGLAQLGLLAQQYELAQYRVKQYSEEMDKLSKDYADGKYSATEYAEKLAELKERQWENVNAAEAAKKAMIDLEKARTQIVIENIEKEIDAFEKLINAEKEALKAEKDLNDYRKSVRDANKSILEIQKQLAAMEGDNSQAAIARRKKLEEQLSEAKQKLADIEADHEYETTVDSLDKQYEAYKEMREREIEELKKALEDIEKTIEELFDTVRENAETIGDTITDEAIEHGVEVSDAITEAWQHGEDAIGRYGDALSGYTSAFMENLQDVENHMWKLQDEANATADTLADMFATNAESLVQELLNSYNSEANLAAMTDALHDSLSNTIDGHYSGDSAASALGKISDAAKDVARNAQEAKRAMQDLLEQESGAKKYALYEVDGDNVRFRGFSSHLPEGYEVRGGMTSEGYYRAYSGYAKGTKRVTKDQLAWTQEKGPEMIISPSSGAILTPLKMNDAVIPAGMTSNLWEWGKFSPEEFAKNLMRDVDVPSSGNVTANTMEVASLITINGPVNDTMEMVKIASEQAASKIKESWNDFSNTLNK